MSSLGSGLHAVDWNSVKLEKFEKNFYAEDRRVSARNEKEIEEFRRLKEIKVCLFICKSFRLRINDYHLGARPWRPQAGHNF
jgi:hypothetical protein